MEKPESVSEAAVNTPFAAASRATVTVSDAPVSGSTIVKPENRLTVAVSSMACPADAPPMVGASFTLLTTMLPLAVLAEKAVDVPLVLVLAFPRTLLVDAVPLV